MKLAIVLWALVCMVCQGQLAMTNNLIGTVDMTSYDTVNSQVDSGYAGYMAGYLKSAFNNIYPQFTNMLVSSSSSGATIQFEVTNVVPQFCPPVWAFATSNKVVPRNFVLANDNGGFQSNTIYPFGVSYYGTPGTMFNGTANTNEGLGLAVQHFFLGANVSAGGNTDTAAQSRNLASMQWMKELGLNPIDLWNDAGTNGLFSVDLTIDSNFYFAGGHPTPKTALQLFTSMWRGLGLKTNLYSFILDYSAVSIAFSNAVTITSVAKSGNNLTWSFKADCMGPSWDILPAISNQVATTLWTNVPNFGNVFQETYRFTNMSSSANYTLLIDSVPVATASGTTWMAGINMATNAVPSNPFNVQKTLVLYDIRDEYGVNHTNGLATHNAGSNPPGGPDLINYGSLMFSKWPTFHGPSLVNASDTQTDINSMWTRAILTHNDAQQTTHSGSLILNGFAAAPFRR